MMALQMRVPDATRAPSIVTLGPSYWGGTLLVAGADVPDALEGEVLVDLEVVGPGNAEDGLDSMRNQSRDKSLSTRHRGRRRSGVSHREASFEEFAYTVLPSHCPPSTDSTSPLT